MVSFMYIPHRVINSENETLSDRKHGVYCGFAFETGRCDQFFYTRKMFLESNSHKPESSVIIRLE